MSGGRRAALAAGLAGLFAGAVALAWFQVCDTDVFWHLKVGEVMLDSGALVRSNLFSSAFADHPWFNPEWLHQVILAGAYRAGGWGGVAALKTALVLLLAGLLSTLLLARRRAPFAAAALALAALAAMRTRLTERPQLDSLVLFAALLLLLELARRRPRLLAALPPLFALWSNLHAELALGLLWLAGAAAGEWLDARIARRAGGGAPPEGAIGARRLALAALLGALASGANPGGYRVLWHPFPHFWQESLIRLGEFRWSLPARAPLLWVLLAAAVAAACHPRLRRRWAELLPLAGIALLAVRYLREIPFFAIAAVPFLHAALADLLPAGRRARALGAAAAGVLALGFLGHALFLEHGLRFRWGFGVNEERFPVAAADFVLEQGLPANLYNHYNDGAYLLWRLWPRLGVFQDGRVSAYPPEFVARLHARRDEGEGEWEAILDAFAVNTAIVHGPEAPLLFDADRWQMVHRGRSYAVVVRRTPGTASLLRRLPEYPLR